MIEIPDPESQDLLVELADEISAAHSKLRNELTNLRALRSALLTALLNQEIEIPESYDVLLEEAS